ncbi:hypothetical protein L0F51_04015 [Afifella sp. H1R]|uniref:hypothetical protein n=1 Tax=Afifella sp. H1R TaxID=2908841 RepID=UPI001F2A61D2|nr:hypothetical protein [Afifella sp. H1R]MCF1502931.1 hypothetical protein [Afifella sp. H1R]
MKANPRPENEFPTVKDMSQAIDHLVELGLGDFPVQLLVVPVSTIEAIARTVDPALPPRPEGKASLMVQLDGAGEARLPVTILSAGYLDAVGHD